MGGNAKLWAGRQKIKAESRGIPLQTISMSRGVREGGEAVPSLAGACSKLGCAARVGGTASAQPPGGQLPPERVSAGWGVGILGGEATQH